MIQTEILESSNLRPGIIVDLNNVLLDDKNNQNKAKFCNIEKIKKKLEEQGYKSIIFIAGANLKNRIDNVKAFDKKIKKREIFISPALEDNDWFILNFAKIWDYDILSNDKFKDYWPEYGDQWIRSKRKTFMIISGELIIKI